jgi:hypothetical protein
MAKGSFKEANDLLVEAVRFGVNTKLLVDRLAMVKKAKEPVAIMQYLDGAISKAAYEFKKIINQ